MKRRVDIHVVIEDITGSRRCHVNEIENDDSVVALLMRLVRAGKEELAEMLLDQYCKGKRVLST